jgi:hypothetical protein
MMNDKLAIRTANHHAIRNASCHDGKQEWRQAYMYVIRNANKQTGLQAYLREPQQADMKASRHAIRPYVPLISKQALLSAC